MTTQYELQPEDLCCLCDPSNFDFATTAEIEPLERVIGQERAVRAIQFGLEMNSAGYHIFVTGPEGTGKTTIVRDIVEKHAGNLPIPDGWCMVNNFQDEYRPKAIRVTPGQAIRFAKSMKRLIDDLKIRLPKELDDESFREKLSDVQKKFGQKKRALMETVDNLAKEKELVINKTSTGFQTIPVTAEGPMSSETFKGLPKVKQEEIETNMRGVQAEMENTVREVARVHQTQQRAIRELTEQTALFVVKNRIELLREAYGDQPGILAYLDSVQEDIVENVEQFLAPQKDPGKDPEAVFQMKGDVLQRYSVNALVDRSQNKGAPVVFEPNPTYQNLFGLIEKKTFMGTVLTDFTLIQAGSLLHANGGFLIVEVEAVLANPFVWEALKRALQNKMLFIEDVGTQSGFGTATLRPEPIPLDVKIILIGGYEPFQILQNYDSKFNKIFKVRADFDYEAPLTDKTIQLYAQFVARVCREESLLPFTPKGVTGVIEYGEKTIANKQKLSLRFGAIVSIIKEADYWARKEESDRVSGDHVAKAVEEYRFRYNLYEEKIHESYADDIIMIDVAGSVTGQVNALAVYQMGEIAFGRPSRITAEAYMGKAGVINIEREAKLSGKTHDKGVLILSGYLGRTFAQKHPLSLSVSITFEQNYGGIDGDSASSTELYAVLSALSDIPVRQGIAVTGSVNQKGIIQAIGGVNHKIEGFFEVCKAKGLTGKQGVMIPTSNVKNLILKKEVLDAVAEGKFHIYQVASIEEGIEILTGVPAGKVDEKGNYPDGTVYGKVQTKLEQYVKQTQQLKKMQDSENL